MTAGGGRGRFAPPTRPLSRDYLLRPDASAPCASRTSSAREAVSRSLACSTWPSPTRRRCCRRSPARRTPRRRRTSTGAAGDFFLESLSTFEMVQRGFAEAREAALLERRQTEMSRQLSTFLADASLALDASDSLEEMLRLVAEQARELVGRRLLRGHGGAGGPAARPPKPPPTRRTSRRWTAFVRWLDLLAIYRLIRAERRLGEDRRRAARSPASVLRSRPSDRPLRGWLAASLTALDGSELGAIQLFDKQGGGFTVDDEAALVHLAQMASAAVERARLYHERG